MAKDYDFSAFNNAVTQHASTFNNLPETEDTPSTLHDLLVSAGQGASLGFGDEALAALESGVSTATGKTKLEDLYNTYRKLQKQHEGEYEQLQQRSPIASTLGELAGGLAMPLGILGEAKTGASIGAKLLQGAKTGALVGGLASAGASHANIEDLPTLGTDIGTGALGGAAIGGAVSGLGQIAEAAGKYGKDYFNESPQLQRAATAFNLEKGGLNLTTEKGGQEILKRTETLANSATDQVLAPLENAKSIYNSEIAKVKNLPVTPETNLIEVGGKEFDPSKSYNLLKDQILDNEEVFKKVYPNIFNKFENDEPLTISDLLNLRGHLIKNSESFNDIRKFPSDASEKIFGRGEDPGIVGYINETLDKYIPNGEKLRSDIKSAATIPEQLLNKNIDPTAQPIKLYDMDADTARKRLTSIFTNKIETAGGTSRSGLQARKVINDLGETIDKNAPSALSTDLRQKLLQGAKEEAALTSTIGIKQTGDPSAAQKLAAYGPIGLPQMGLTEVAGKTGRILNKAQPLVTGVSNIATAPAKAVNETAMRMAQGLKNHSNESLRKLGESLDVAMQNKSSPSVAAAINSIMQSTSARQALGLQLGKSLDKQNNTQEGTGN